MKTVFGNAQCVHVWAQQTQAKGKTANGNMFFEGETIYSYGYHFPLAHFVTDRRVLVNEDRYSISTAKHQGYVRQAVNHLDRLYVSTEFIKTYKWENAFSDRVKDVLIREAKRAIENAIESASKRRMNKKKDDDIFEGLATLESKLKLFEVFKQEKPLELLELKANIEQGASVAIAQHKERKEQERKAKELKELQYQSMVEAAIKSHWLNNLPMSETGCSAQSSKRIYMRVNGDDIETTRGARFPLEHAKRAFQFVRHWKENNTGENWNNATNRNIRLGHFQIDIIDTQGNVTAGCHYVEWAQIEHVARVLGIYP